MNLKLCMGDSRERLFLLGVQDKQLIQTEPGE